MTLRQRGFSLLELAVALVVLGGLAGIALTAAAWASQRHRIVEARHALERAEQALIAYAESHSRLPCPDADGSGLEDCGSGAGSGRLPYATLVVSPAGEGSEVAYTVVPLLARSAEAEPYDFCRTLHASAQSARPAAVLSVSVRAGAGDAAPDGLTRAIGPYELAGRLRCGGMLASLEALENESVAARLTAETLSLSAEWAKASTPDAVPRGDLLAGYRDEVLRLCAALGSLAVDAGGGGTPCE